MNILLISQYFYPERFIITELAQDLGRLGHSITVLTGMPNYPAGRLFPGYRRAWPKRETLGNLQIIRVPLVPRGRASNLQLAVNYLSFALSALLLAPFLLRAKADAILVYALSPYTVGLPAMLFKWLKKAPMLFWVQDLWPESLTATGAVKNPLALRVVRELVRLIYRHCDLILVQSEAFTQKVRDHAPSDCRVLFLPNPADRIYRPVPPADAAPEDALMRPGFRAVFAGNMGAAQDIGNILGAAERLKHVPGIQWILIGDGRRRAWVEEEVRARGLESNVQLLGPFPSERMPKFFAVADVLLVTLRREEIFALTIPSKLQAYLACARPIVAAIEGEAARVVRDAGVGLVCQPGDAEGLARAVETLSRMPDSERVAMGNAGRRYFEREFDRDMLVKRLETFLFEAKEN
jgi:glycosyltransferase involved in cell wall biosynthesis